MGAGTALNKTKAATIDEILEEAEYTEHHLHNREKWFGDAAVPVGEDHVADRVGGTTTSFQLVAGNNDFGQWVQVLGANDTPVEAGKTLFDAHRYLVTTTNHFSTWTLLVPELNPLPLLITGVAVFAGFVGTLAIVLYIKKR